MELHLSQLSAQLHGTKADQHNLPDLLGRRVGYSEPAYPGFYHEHHLADYSVAWLDEACQAEFDYSLQEIQAMGPAFQEYVTHPQDLPRVREALQDLAARANERERITLLQRFKLKTVEQEGYTLVLTGVCLDLNRQRYLCMTNTTDQLPLLTQKLCESLNQKHEVKAAASNYMRLTPREQEILSYLLADQSVKEIAQLISRSTHTVEQHKKNIYRKLGVNSLKAVVRLGCLLGLV